jgi:hypothetical protein
MTPLVCDAARMWLNDRVGPYNARILAEAFEQELVRFDGLLDHGRMDLIWSKLERRYARKHSP